VKLRGVLVEIEEIEAALRQHPGVRETFQLIERSQGSESYVAFLSRSSR
jgi:hypothetical protein